MGHYGLEGEAVLRAEVERISGGTVVEMERQLRWRPAWFATIKRGNQNLRVYIRGDRQSDVMPFPELAREARIMKVLHAHGVPVPAILGDVASPQAIIMESIPGTRDMSLATDAERASIAREYIAAVAAMHRIDPTDFEAQGLSRPIGAREIALAGVDAYMPLYLRNKRRPQPLIELALSWLRANPPEGRKDARFVQFDSGQFHFADGKLTGLYDFEFGLIGDPLADLATMRMRESNEPLGEDMRVLIQHYERETGRPVDHAALAYHTLVFATVATMQFSSTIADPAPGAPHAVYLEFDLALRQTLILAFAECLGRQLPDPKPLGGPKPRLAALHKMIEDALVQVRPATPMDQDHKTSVSHLLEYAALADAYQSEIEEHDLSDARGVLGLNCKTIECLDSCIECLIMDADQKSFTKMFDLLARRERRRLSVFGSTAIGRSATKAFIPASR